MKNALTIDVEDYFMVSAFADIVKFEDWGNYESRVEQSTYKILELLDEHDVKATFFVLGWVAEHYPGIVRDIHKRGHEVASHGYNHRLVYNLAPDDFREDTRKAKQILEDITGEPVYGYRAASYSVTEKSIWALDILIEEGFIYDSSIFPVRHDRYGIPSAERLPHHINRNSGSIYEFPLSTYRVLGQNIPVAGGGYLRLFPLFLTKASIRAINNTEGKPFIFYLHPWEIDLKQPRMNSSMRSYLRHYHNLSSTMPKLRELLRTFEFIPLFELISSE